ncbi:hypothetical protein [Micromonospora sp. NPDC005324]|uniref:hypothetical protein n=1 Tax=Micromonospora sp. NPDC005324 TaxID=3157033 RepID=UPI0033BD6A0B
MQLLSRHKPAFHLSRRPKLLDRRGGRGWALLQAINALPYYVDTNPVMAGIARHTLLAVLD